jgi:hypothetical protein
LVALPECCATAAAAPAATEQITHIFKEVLHGQGRFVMVVNVSPAAEEFNETKRVLQVCIAACSGSCHGGI